MTEPREPAGAATSAEPTAPAGGGPPVDPRGMGTGSDAQGRGEGGVGSAGDPAGGVAFDPDTAGAPAEDSGPRAGDELARPEDDGLAPPGDEAPSPRAVRRRTPLLLALGLIAAGLLGGVVTFGGLAASGRLKPDPTPTAAPTPTPVAAPALETRGGDVGAADAPVTIEIWADFQCPYCRLETVLFGPALEREYVLTRRARIAYRDFAFLGQESIDAAVAARCAGRQQPAGYWRYHDLLFVQQQGENQGAFSRENLLALARFAGLEPTAFTACLDDPAVASAVADEKAADRAWASPPPPR